jgi:hypothetical protein
MSSAWISLFVVLAKLTLWVLKTLERKRIQDEVIVEVVRQLEGTANDFIGSIDDTIGNVSNTPDDILLDPANRDQTEGKSGDPKGVV